MTNPWGISGWRGLDKDGEEETIHGMDSVVLALGVESVDKLSEQLKSRVAEVHVIGDAKEPATPWRRLLKGLGSERESSR